MIMFYQPPSLTLSWNLIKEKKKKGKPVCMEIQSDLICAHWYLFHLPEAQRAFEVQRLLGVSAGPTVKWMTVPQTRMGIWTPAAPVAPETLQPAHPSSPAPSSTSPSAKNSPSLSLSSKRSRFGLQYRTAYICEKFFRASLVKREAIFAHTPAWDNRALCKAAHPHMVGMKMKLTLHKGLAMYQVKDCLADFKRQSTALTGFARGWITTGAVQKAKILPREGLSFPAQQRVHRSPRTALLELRQIWISSGDTSVPQAWVSMELKRQFMLAWNFVWNQYKFGSENKMSPKFSGFIFQKLVLVPMK